MKITLRKVPMAFLPLETETSRPVGGGWKCYGMKEWTEGWLGVSLGQVISDKFGLG